jgi:glutathione synthase/RimK-type ligase-like ATP-grasp enzyme
VENKVVVFAPDNDIHAAAVCYGLRKNGIIPIQAASLASHSSPMISISCSKDSGLLLSEAPNFPSIRSVWERRLKLPSSPNNCNQSDKKFVRTEWMSFQRNFFDLPNRLFSALWVNDHSAALRAENKLLQLDVARAVELSLPDTLVSNNPGVVKNFITKQKNIVVKTFSPHSWSVSGNGAIFVTSPAIIDSADSIEDESIRLCPAIYQKIVNKTHDIRVTVIGHNTFSVKLSSTEGGALLDWRPSVYTSALAFESCRIPERLECKIKLLMQKLGINFGCVDLAVDKNGDAYFLEINQAGQFLFVEKLVPSLPLVKALCAMLIQGRTNYSLNLESEVSYRDFKESDAYEEFLEVYNSPTEADRREGEKYITAE